MPIKAFCSSFRSGYSYYLHNSDPRVMSWPLLNNDSLNFFIIFFYIFFVLYLGPRIMKNREPFDLRRILVSYNLALVFANLCIFLQYVKIKWFGPPDVGCVPLRFSNSPESFRLTEITWWYYLTKYIELLDTVFFVLRKKDNQLSKLHLIHHTSVPLMAFALLRYEPGGYNTFFPQANAFVHCVMYTYYAMSAFGDDIRDYLWFKKYVTISQMEIPILKRLERQHTLLNTAVDPANPEWHEMTLRTMKHMESFSGSSESRSSSSNNSVASSSERYTSNTNTPEAETQSTSNSNNLPVPAGTAMVITDTDLASSWLYKRRRGMFETEHDGGTCNEAFETSMTDSVVDSPPSILAPPPPPPPPTPNRSPANDFKQPFIFPPALLLPEIQKFRKEDDSPESLPNIPLKPIPIAKKKRSKSTYCCYLTVLLVAFVCMFGLLSAIGGIVYLEVFTSGSRALGRLKDTRANVAGPMFEDYGIPDRTKSDKSSKHVESQQEFDMQPESSNNNDESPPTSTNEEYNSHRNHVRDSFNSDTGSDPEVKISISGSDSKTKTTPTELDSVMPILEVNKTEKHIVSRIGEMFGPDPVVDVPTDTVAGKPQDARNAQKSNDCDYNISEMSGKRAPCRITLQVSEDVVPVVSIDSPPEGSRQRQRPITTSMDSSNDMSKLPEPRHQMNVNIKEITDQSEPEDSEYQAERQQEMDGTTGLSFVHNIIETKPLASTISESSMENTQPTPVLRDQIVSRVHLQTPTRIIDQSAQPVFRTSLPESGFVDDSNDGAISSDIIGDDDPEIKFIDTEDEEMFPEYSVISENDQRTNTDENGRSQDGAPMKAISGVNIPAPPIRIPQSSMDVFPSSFDRIINNLKRTNSRQSLINQRQMVPVSEFGFAKRRLTPTVTDSGPVQDIFNIQRPKHGRLQESIAEVLKRFQTLENSNLPGSRAAGSHRVQQQQRTPRVSSGAEELEKQLYLDKIRVMLYDN